MTRLAVTVALVLAAAVAVPLAWSAGKAEPFDAYAVPHRVETRLPPAGRAGDRDLLYWTIRDRHGNAFGLALLDCDWFPGGYRLCVGTFRLARGTFFVTGASRGRSFGSLEVLHGTGDYATPRGPLTFNATRGGKLSLRGSF